MKNSVSMEAPRQEPGTRLQGVDIGAGVGLLDGKRLVMSPASWDLGSEELRAALLSFRKMRPALDARCPEAFRGGWIVLERQEGLGQFFTVHRRAVAGAGCSSVTTSEVTAKEIGKEGMAVLVDVFETLLRWDRESKGEVL